MGGDKDGEGIWPKCQSSDGLRSSKRPSGFSLSDLGATKAQEAPQTSSDKWKALLLVAITSVQLQWNRQDSVSSLLSWS